MEGNVSRFHEEQHFHDALMGLLVLAMIFIVGVTVLAVVLSRPNDALLLATAPVVVVLVAALISLSHLDVDVTDSGVSIAFRHLWPTRRIAFGDIVGLEVKHYRPLIDYGGWGVCQGRDGEKILSARGDRGVRLRLADGSRLVIGSQRPEELALALEARDWAALASTAHTLKGSANNLGARQLASLMASLEKQAKTGELPEAANILLDVQCEFQAVEKAHLAEMQK